LDSSNKQERQQARRRWWQQPLLHFAVIGMALFALYQWTASRSTDDEKTIVVDRAALLTYMQYRAKFFDPERSQDLLAALDEEELNRLIDDYVREEVLYREAKALGLDRDDFVIRQRLIQKLDFINRDLSAQLAELSESEIRQYFDANRDDYRKASRVVMTHVFFDQRAGGREQAEQRARATLRKLNASRTPFHEGPRQGDWFFYDVNFVGASEKQIRRFLGPEVAEAAMSVDPKSDFWYGPYPSEYGYHLVMITDRSPAGHYELEEIRERVEGDARRDRETRLGDAVMNKVIEAYDVRIEYESAPEPTSEAAAAQE
jgi:hypothetical protein